MWQGEGEVAQTMYIHISKCKNDKIKERKKEITNKMGRKLQKE
jgi:hypothetical protein